MTGASARCVYFQDIPQPTPLAHLVDELPLVQVGGGGRGLGRRAIIKLHKCSTNELSRLSVSLSQGKSQAIKVLNRLTIVISDGSQFVS